MTKTKMLIQKSQFIRIVALVINMGLATVFCILGYPGTTYARRLAQELDPAREHKSQIHRMTEDLDLTYGEKQMIKSLILQYERQILTHRARHNAELEAAQKEITDLSKQPNPDAATQEKLRAVKARMVEIWRDGPDFTETLSRIIDKLPNKKAWGLERYFVTSALADDSNILEKIKEYLAGAKLSPAQNRKLNELLAVFATRQDTFQEELVSRELTKLRGQLDNIKKQVDEIQKNAPDPRKLIADLAPICGGAALINLPFYGDQAIERRVDQLTRGLNLSPAQQRLVDSLVRKHAKEGQAIPEPGKGTRFVLGGNGVVAVPNGPSFGRLVSKIINALPEELAWEIERHYRNEQKEKHDYEIIDNSQIISDIKNRITELDITSDRRQKANNLIAAFEVDQNTFDAETGDRLNVLFKQRAETEAQLQQLQDKAPDVGRLIWEFASNLSSIQQRVAFRDAVYADRPSFRQRTNEIRLPGNGFSSLSSFLSSPQE